LEKRVEQILPGSGGEEEWRGGVRRRGSGSGGSERGSRGGGKMA
jgi:hypothetical protein